MQLCSKKYKQFYLQLILFIKNFIKSAEHVSSYKGNFFVIFETRCCLLIVDNDLSLEFFICLFVLICLSTKKRRSPFTKISHNVQYITIPSVVKNLNSETKLRSLDDLELIFIKLSRKTSNMH